MGRGAWKKGQFQQSAQKWGTGYSGAQTAIVAGVAAPKQSPTQAAIKQINVLVQNLMAAFNGGPQSTWAMALAQAGDQAWAEGMKLFAAGGLAAKATKGQPHYQAFAQSYGPQVIQAAQNLSPRGDFAANQQRAAQMSTWEHQQRGKFRKLWRNRGQMV